MHAQVTHKLLLITSEKHTRKMLTSLSGANDNSNAKKNLKKKQKVIILNIFFLFQY